MVWFMATLTKIKSFYYVLFMVEAEWMNKGFYTVTHTLLADFSFMAARWKCGKHDSNNLWQQQTEHVSSGHPGFL